VSEPSFGFRIAYEFGTEELQDDWAVEPEVPGPIDYTNPAANVLEDLVVTNRLPDEGGHDNSSSGGRKKKASVSPHRRISAALSKS